MCVYTHVTFPYSFYIALRFLHDRPPNDHAKHLQTPHYTFNELQIVCTKPWAVNRLSVLCKIDQWVQKLHFRNFLKFRSSSFLRLCFVDSKFVSFQLT